MVNSQSSCPTWMHTRGIWNSPMIQHTFTNKYHFYYVFFSHGDYSTGVRRVNNISLSPASPPPTEPYFYGCQTSRWRNFFLLICHKINQQYTLAIQCYKLYNNVGMSAYYGLSGHEQSALYEVTRSTDTETYKRVQMGREWPCGDIQTSLFCVRLNCIARTL